MTLLGPTLNPAVLRSRAIAQRLRQLSSTHVYIAASITLPGGDSVRQSIVLSAEELEKRDAAGVLLEILECLCAAGERRAP